MARQRQPPPRASPPLCQNPTTSAAAARSQPGRRSVGRRRCGGERGCPRNAAGPGEVAAKWLQCGRGGPGVAYPRSPIRHFGGLPGPKTEPGIAQNARSGAPKGDVCDPQSDVSRGGTRVAIDPAKHIPKLRTPRGLEAGVEPPRRQFRSTKLRKTGQRKKRQTEKARWGNGEMGEMGEMGNRETGKREHGKTA